MKPPAPDEVPSLLASVSLAVSVASLVIVMVIGRKTIRIGEEAVKAERESLESAERSREVAEASVRQATADAEGRRVERLLDVLIDMRETFNRQEASTGGLGLIDIRTWPPSPQEQERLALCRRLEARLPPIEEYFDDKSMVRYLSRSTSWTSAQLETAILEAKALLRRISKPDEVTQAPAAVAPAR